MHKLTRAAAALVLVLPQLAHADQWRSIGPGAPTPGDLLIDPVAPSTVYLNTAVGLFKSGDGGATWLRLANGLPPNVTDFSLSPSTRASRYAGPSSLFATTTAAIYRSLDGGETWRQVTTPAAVAIHEVAVHPSNSQIVYIRTTSSGAIEHILKSVDGGETWQGTGSSSLPVICGEQGFCARRLDDLVVDPSNPEVLHAGPYRSLDGGTTWQLIGPAPTNPFAAPYVRNWVYTVQAHYRSSNGIQISRDGGGTWAPFSGPPTAAQGVVFLGADLRNRAVYAGTAASLFRTVDGGRTWVPGPPPPAYPFSIDPAVPSTLYIDSRWKSVDYGRTWIALPATGLGAVPGRTTPTVAPSRPDTVYAVAGNRLHVSTDGGGSWMRRDLPAGFSITAVAIDPADDRVVYALDGEYGRFTPLAKVLRSGDRGISWAALSADLPCGAPTYGLSLASGPNDAVLVLSASRELNGSSPPVCFGVLRSTDGGTTWTSISSLRVRAVVVHPTDPAIIFLVGARPTHLQVTPILQRSIDGGASFQTIDGAPPLTSLVIDPAAPGVLYGAAETKVYKSTDGGDTWQQIGDPLANRVQRPDQSYDGRASLTVNAASDDVFVATETTGGTALMLPSGEAAWVDLPGPDVWSLALAPGATPILYGGTFGRGVWSVNPTVATPTLSLNASTDGSPLTGSLPAGATVFVDAVSTGVANPVYRFSRWDPGVGWRVVRDYDAQPGYSWTPGPADAGSHTFQVGVRPAGAAAAAAIASLPLFAVAAADVTAPPSNLVARSAPQDLDYFLIDYNADAVKDLFVHNRASGEWAVYLGTGAGTFTPGISGGWAPGWQISVADFNGDLFTDFFLYSRATGVFYKVINTGSGFRYFTQGWRAGFDVHIVDFNGDGRSDVFVINPLDGVWYTCISSGDGTGSFTYTSGRWATGWAVSRGDFDGNGRDDLFLFNRGTGVYYKVIWMPDGSFRYQAGQGPAATAPTVLDLSGDGRSDVLFYDPIGGAFERCTSVGDGTSGFDCDRGGWLPGFSVHAAAFDTDARTDLFLHQASTGLWYKVLNYANGFHYVSGGWAQWRIMVSDLNGDQRSDVLLIDPSSGVYYEALTGWAHTFVYTTGQLQ